jgi:catechol 2,3-dioxygenase-like lactoylglutathione lyase family enzyme
MPDNTKPNPPRPVLTATEAQLFVADVAVSCAFYKDKLGFAVEFAYGDPPFYALVVRDRARLTLRGVDEPVFVAGVREREGLLSASLTLATAAETKQLFHTYEAARAPMQQPLKQEAWGATTFVVKDPDGNLVLFAGPAE